ncbi:MAG: N-acetyl-gamma-glutamyl-phosphate reductase [Endomicrobiia bacterium]|nr:N-acetyl-gamma-glutamyl-phosphate reductase [Endomicrobiia bacterium]
MINTAVIGIGGYTGEELLKILSKHPKAVITAACARGDTVGKKLGAIYPHLDSARDVVCEAADPERIASSCDAAFLALPHCEAAPFGARLAAAGVKVIDLSADFRLKDPAVYAKWYKIAHPRPDMLAGAVYGLCELNREKIKKASIVANPGCYPTTAILGLAPLLKRRADDCDLSSIIIDSKSGVSGGGRRFAKQYFEQDHPDHKPYNIAGGHRHIPEMEQELSSLGGADIKITFTPSIIPVERGMLSVIYIGMKNRSDAHELTEMYRSFYEGERFVRVLDEDRLPSIKNALNTNFCDIAVRFDERTSRAVIVSAIDNLIKGASGQAAQNFNILFGLDEAEGIL